MKKAVTKKPKARKAADHDFEAELRYRSAAKIAKDFPGKKERKAIAAFFKWLSMNSVCAWRDKDRRYGTDLITRGMVVREGPYDAILIKKLTIDQAMRAFGIRIKDLV